MELITGNWHGHEHPIALVSVFKKMFALISICRNLSTQWLHSVYFDKFSFIESGLKGGFHENISYDHSECCQEKGISPLCRAMCKPSEMAEHHFDPTRSVFTYYYSWAPNLSQNSSCSAVKPMTTRISSTAPRKMEPEVISTAARRSWCRRSATISVRETSRLVIQPFGGEFWIINKGYPLQMLRRAHRLCLYYLPEIFECYNRAYRMLVNPPLEHFRSRDSVPVHKFSWNLSPKPL